jgi:hypothetical protein
MEMQTARMPCKHGSEVRRRLLVAEKAYNKDKRASRNDPIANPCAEYASDKDLKTLLVSSRTDPASLRDFTCWRMS